MSVNYIILRNSTQQAEWDALTTEQKALDENFKGRKFRVSVTGYKAGLHKTGEERETLGGVLDVSVGPMYWSAQYVLRVTHTPPTEEIADHQGSYAELEALFKLNNPLGTPTNLITLVDHYGVSRNGFLRGDHLPEPLTTFLDGEYAYYFIPIRFLASQAV